MIKIKVLYGTLFNTTWQDKTFKDEVSCVKWCHKHYANIGCINEYRTSFLPISHYEIMDAIKGTVN